MTQVFKIFFLSSLIFLAACSTQNDDLMIEEPCEDGIQNRTETGLDCGGECKECPDLEPITSRFYLQFERAGLAQVYQDQIVWVEQTD